MKCLCSVGGGVEDHSIQLCIAACDHLTDWRDPSAQAVRCRLYSGVVRIWCGWAKWSSKSFFWAHSNPKRFTSQRSIRSSDHWRERGATPAFLFSSWLVRRRRNIFKLMHTACNILMLFETICGSSWSFWATWPRWEFNDILVHQTGC